MEKFAIVKTSCGQRLVQVEDEAGNYLYLCDCTGEEAILRNKTTWEVIESFPIGTDFWDVAEKLND